MEGQLLTMVQVTAMLGIIAPPFLALLKRTNWPEQTKDMVILAILVVVGVVAAFAVGDISVTACSALDLAGCVGVVIGYVSLVVAQAFTWYKMLYKPSGIDDKIAGQ